MVSGVCSVGGGDLTRREFVRREQPPHRRILLQGARSSAPSGSRDRSAARGRRPLDQRRPRRQPAMKVVIVDYGSGNLRSAAKAFERTAAEDGITARIEVTNEPEVVA